MEVPDPPEGGDRGRAGRPSQVDPPRPRLSLSQVLLEEEPPAPAAAGAGAALVAPRPRASWARPATLLVGSSLLLGFDLAFAITGWISWSLTAVETLLVPAWLAAVVVLERRASVLAGARPRKPRMATLLIALALLLACIAEKWILLGHATGEGAGERVVVLYRAYTVIAFVIANGGLLGRRPLERLLVTAAEHPARLMLLSFGVAALLGSFLLTLPQAVHRMADARFIDGLFMAASAVCVTGLAVHNVADTYTPFGQGILLALIQIGGLGIMVLSTFFAILAGRRIHLRDAAVMAEMIDSESFARLRRNVAVIVLSTVIVEAIGAAALYVAFSDHAEIGATARPGTALTGAGSHLWAAVFHSVSAFCNAGFSIFRDGLLPFAWSPAVCSVVMLLVILGGLGFPVHDELLRRARARLFRARPHRLSLHTRVVLLSTAVLIALGTVGFMALEWSRSMAHHPVHVRALTAVFQSVMTRTAGFNTLDFAAMGHATWMFTCILMFIGAAPGSTGGGVKVTTVSVLFATLRAELRGYEAPRLLGRSIPAAVVRRAMAVSFLFILLVASFLFALLLFEHQDPLSVAFEAVSASATVGLSTGITPALSTPGKLLVTALM
ncbi:MAG TPA: TrkH family potassium uptake protein, partial [Candidatus Nanopelagicales bacterium]|nr:TrkH family potassium uptake protein [Candidatus Nanopelagicales bacterium]